MKGCIPLFMLIAVPVYGQLTELSEEEGIGGLEDIASLDLNQADEYTLRQLSSLEDTQIDAILEYRKQFGAFLSIYELQAIPGLLVRDIRELTSVFYVSENKLPISSQPESFALLRVKYEPVPRLGFNIPNGFRGDRQYMMFRMHYRAGPFWELALTMEKDAGEKFGFKPGAGLYGFDHLAGFLQWTNRKKLRLVAGNYQVHFGQGLTAGAGFSLGKGTEPVVSARGGKSGIRGYRGLAESGSLRGVAGILASGQNELAAYLGESGRNATLYDEGDGPFIHSLNDAGLHRTPSEIEKRKNIRLQTAGIYFTRTMKFVTLGIHYRIDKLNIPIKNQPSWYDAFGWEGRELQNTALFISYQRKNLYSWLEAAWAGEARHAIQAGLLVHLSRLWAGALMIRNYSPGYFAFDGQAFGERTEPSNEQGLYIGLSYSPKKRWNLTGYLDVFRFPWLTSSLAEPGSGLETMLSGTVRLRNQMELRTNFRYERKPVNYVTGSWKQGQDRHIHQAGIYTGKALMPWLEWRFKVQGKRVIHGADRFKGMAAYQELILKLRRITLSYRYAIFKSNDYAARVYLYERDLWGSFSLPALNGDGIRQYVLIRWKAGRTMDFWVRFARTRYREAKKASGPDDIPGKNRDLLSAQIRIKL